MRTTIALRFIPPLALMGLIYFLSAQPDLSTGLGVWDLILRKIAHASAYAALTLLWLRALGPFTGRALLWAVAIAFLFAISDEYHQTFVEGRHGSPIDVGIDTVGIVIAILVSRTQAFQKWGSTVRRSV
jgi:VanZ family protein